MTASIPSPLADVLARIVAPGTPALADALQHLLDHKTKPVGSLGRLEPLARQIGEIGRASCRERV